jgi:hypothetical protein
MKTNTEEALCPTHNSEYAVPLRFTQIACGNFPYSQKLSVMPDIVNKLKEFVYEHKF